MLRMCAVGFTVGDVMNARFFFEANIRGFEFFEKKANKFTGLCSSATRTVIGSQFVPEKLSIALLF